MLKEIIMIKKLCINEFSDFRDAYRKGIDKIPLPFEFFVDGKKYVLDFLYENYAKNLWSR